MPVLHTLIRQYAILAYVSLTYSYMPVLYILIFRPIYSIMSVLRTLICPSLALLYADPIYSYMPDLVYILISQFCILLYARSLCSYIRSYILACAVLIYSYMPVLYTLICWSYILVYANLLYSYSCPFYSYMPIPYIPICQSYIFVYAGPLYSHMRSYLPYRARVAQSVR